MDKLVSIIIPAYCVEAWIEKCLQSVTEQTYKVIEIIVIDDGSKDGTGTICDDMAKQDKRIRVIHQENQGVSEARNCGLRMAEGAYVCFVDGDDYLGKNYIELLYNTMEHEGIQLAVCGYAEVFENGKIKRVVKDGAGIRGGEEILEDLFFHDGIGRTLWNKMMDRNVIQKAQLRFSQDYMVGEDLLFLIQYLNCINWVEIVGEIGYYYLWRNSSAMQRQCWDNGYYENRSSWLRAVDTMETLLAKKNKQCQKVFKSYKVMVCYRILCESRALGRNVKDERRRCLEGRLRVYVRKYGITAALSGIIPKKTAFGLLLCCISPELQIFAAKLRS